MQDEVNTKVVAIAVKGGKITAEVLEKALRKFIEEIEKAQKTASQPKTYRGKQSIKHLVEQNAAISNIEVTDGNIKYFERTAKKYGIDYVFVDALGRRMKPDYISSTFSVLLEKNGLKRIRFHDLRHSCASLLLANGVPMKQIQEWLGHSDFNTTANIYAHLDYSSKVTSAQAMEKVLPLPAGFNTNGWNGVVSL